MKVYNKLFAKIVSPENLFEAWDEFRRGKRGKFDVQAFEFHLEQNIFQLNRDLTSGNYRHGAYKGFFINDPKRRHIYKATVRDRVLHHAIFRVLNPIFERSYYHNSFSCRVGKGNHKGVDKAAHLAVTGSRNCTVTCYALKCDIRKFFDSISHDVLLGIINKKIVDDDLRRLLRIIVNSYDSDRSTLLNRRGVPIGNLTSQMFANVYMNEFDQFVKHVLRAKHYIRYTDDFIIFSDNRAYLENLLTPIKISLKERLDIELHPDKISIRKFRQGIDFLGYVTLPHYRLVRRQTMNRINRKLRARVAQRLRGDLTEESLEYSLQSFLGVLSHADAYRLSRDLKNNCWFWLNE